MKICMGHPTANLARNWWKNKWKERWWWWWWWWWW